MQKEIKKVINKWNVKQKTLGIISGQYKKAEKEKNKNKIKIALTLLRRGAFVQPARWNLNNQ